MAAQRRLVAELRADKAIDPSSVVAPAVVSSAVAHQANLLDPTNQFAQIRASGYSDSGTKAAMDLVHRIRGRYVPAAGFGDARVFMTGAPAFGVDFLAKAYGAFPWLVVAVLVISYFLLLRAFRSVVLPIKAVFMNLLSVAATYGVLVMFFQVRSQRHMMREYAKTRAAQPSGAGEQAGADATAAGHAPEASRAPEGDQAATS